MFALGALGDLFKSKALEGSTIVLHDINPHSLQKVEQTSNAFLAQKHLNYTIEATTSRKDALQGADFCIISIEIGNRYQLWEQDWRMAQQFGIPQVYGENGGPGGIFHALRIVPPILDICQDINDICPQALVINLSNPMSVICLAISKKFPNLKLVGLCHEISSIIEHIPKLLKRSMDKLDLRVGGLNHFSVLCHAQCTETGADLYPEILKNAPSYYADMPERE